MAPPKTILLTPSDALSITDLASCTYRGDRCFAVQGGLVAGGSDAPVRVVHPAGADAGALQTVTEFLRALGGAVTVEEDSVAPVLVKSAWRWEGKAGA
jgi:3-hydroxybutyryl-CoA dehydrogenase